MNGGGIMTEKCLYCSFCGKKQDEVAKLIAGPSVYICNECVALSQGIIDEEKKLKVLAVSHPHSASLYTFLAYNSGCFIESSVICSDEILAETLEISIDDLHKALRTLKRKKLIEILPCADGMTLYFVSGKNISKTYDEETKLYRVAANVLLQPNPKLKMLP
ncbi:unnamed protein product [Photorhabdus laumondii subsp. laumondii TTO1]|uniref:Photorhabdus luminescens subsp. laumondii TTO1 complete genome segment 3/17 n=2 Tax=Photorhabdus TaxID=29487 RepID=Q7N887_PHOLL|nr:unnamed protein product [Photorhabdus laumondii subsp. laumondii TTO1]